MKTAEDAIELSKLMVNIGKFLNKSITAVITSMEEPLGRAIGNSLEIIESIEFLKGNIKKGDLAELTYSFATIALMQLGLYNDKSEAETYLKELVSSGKAIEKFKELINAQNGNTEVINNYDLFDLPTYKIECESKKNGYVHNIDAYKIAYACKILGAGRDKKSDPIDYSVGIYLNKKSGDSVRKGDILYTIYSNNPEKTKLAQKYCDEAFVINENRPYRNSLIYKIVSGNVIYSVKRIICRFFLKDYKVFALLAKCGNALRFISHVCIIVFGEI
jgi:thymidine phosphorylase